MKEILKELYSSNKNAMFNVWIYLWLNSNKKNEIKVSVDEISKLFDIPRTTLARSFDNLDKYFFKENKIYCESKKNTETKKAIYEFIFYPNGKDFKSKKISENLEERLSKELYKDFLIEFYKSRDYDYPNLRDQVKYAVHILKKIRGAVILRTGNIEPSENEIKDAFIIFFENIPQWWVDNGNLGLVVINKNFSRILNQIKTKTNNDKYSKIAEESKSIDYTNFATDGSGGSWADAFS